MSRLMGKVRQSYLNSPKTNFSREHREPNESFFSNKNIFSPRTTLTKQVLFLSTKTFVSLFA